MRWLLFAWLVSLTIILALEVRDNDMPSTGGGLTEQQQAAQGFADVYAAIDQVNARIPKYMDAKFWSGLTPKVGQVPIFDGATKRFKPGIIFLRKTIDEEVTSSTTLQPDDELTATVGANETWRFLFYLIVNGQSATPDIKIQFSFPSALYYLGAWGLNTAATSLTELASFAAFGSGTTSVTTTWGTITSKSPMFIFLVLKTTAGGTVVMNWAQNTSSADWTSVVEGSSMEGQRLK